VPVVLAVAVLWQERARRAKVRLELQARRAAEARGN
jgi:hypothetical protein